MQDPLVARDHQSTINAAVFVHIFAVGGKWSALILQAAEVLPVPTMDDARAPSGETACEEIGAGGGDEQMVSISIRKGVKKSLRTKTAFGEAVE